MKWSVNAVTVLSQNCTVIIVTYSDVNNYNVDIWRKKKNWNEIIYYKYNIYIYKFVLNLCKFKNKKNH